MGGKALALNRINKNEYFEIFSELQCKISKYFNKFELIPSYYNKNSFGDMDILCCYNNKFSIEKILNDCNSKKFVKNGNVLSLEYKNFQIDIIHTKEKFFNTSLTYYSYNDLGNFMGRIAANMHINIKYGHFGLKKIFYSSNKDRIIFEAILSTDSSKIFDFLGFSYERFMKGFNDITDIFDYVISSKYYSNHIFDYDNLNNENRTRNKKRESYNMFLDYINQSNKIVSKIDIDFKSRLENYFPNVIEFEKIANEKIIHQNLLREKFNGKIFQNITSLSGKELGKKISEFKSKYSDSFLIAKTNKEIEDLIINFCNASCITCKHFYFYPPQFDQPYPEISCLKKHWESISTSEEYDSLSEKNQCKDFEAKK